MGVIIKMKPNGVKFLQVYPRVKDQLQKVVSLDFFDKFDGNKREVKNALA